MNESTRGGGEKTQWNLWVGWERLLLVERVWTGHDGYARIMEIEGTVVITQFLTYTFHQQLENVTKIKEP